ncbi:MBL fold metallo-hydrolase [Parashewanella curva]|uniref:MBL fold metallo-hydrolase n=1 Tax=Parashewanella curva TaxID=2338552 RepID=A0A3L8PWB7_9GAMM|nr:MBL fold metallo-hydrolase [Parashewanella curva]RLV58913.1 MBL fold metallo-hydrolase [Parashewanella curva]
MKKLVRCLALCTLIAASAQASQMKVVILGTGTPNPDPERSGPALAVIKDDQSYLIDAGPGVVRRAESARQKHNIPALAASQLQTAFLTHLHTDHTVGLPDLLFTSWTLERPVPLAVYGPEGTGKMMKHLQNAYQQDIDIRLNGLEPANDKGYQVDVTEFKGSKPLLVKGDFKVTAIPVLHGSWQHSFGYKFEDGKRSIVISGDARPSPELIKAAKGVDVLVHEVYSTEGFKTRPPVWQKYHSSFHTSTKELAEIAKETQPKLFRHFALIFPNT